MSKKQMKLETQVLYTYWLNSLIVISNLGYIFWLKDDGKWICIDATSESSHPARLINHSKKKNNLVVKCTNKKRIVFKALDDIPAGRQLFYNYNEDRPDVIKENIWMKN